MQDEKRAAPAKTPLHLLPQIHLGQLAGMTPGISPSGTGHGLAPTAPARIPAQWRR